LKEEQVIETTVNLGNEDSDSDETVIFQIQDDAMREEIEVEQTDNRYVIIIKFVF
jgi:hypothetical protein